MEIKQKRKRVLLTLEARLELIERINNGENFLTVAKEYNIGRATIRDIYARKDEYINFARNSDSFNAALRRKTLKRSSLHVLDTKLYNWFKDQRNSGITVTKAALVENACRIHTELGITETFLASDGWIHGFKGRHGIENLDTPGENMPETCFEQALDTSSIENISSNNINFVKMEPSDEVENIETYPYFETNDTLQVKYELKPEDSMANVAPEPDPPFCEERPSCSTSKVTEIKDDQLEQFSTFLMNEIRSIKSKKILRKLRLNIMGLVCDAQEEDDNINADANNS